MAVIARNNKARKIFYPLYLFIYSCRASIDIEPQLLHEGPVPSSCHSLSCLTVDHGPSSQSGKGGRDTLQMVNLSSISISINVPGSPSKNSSRRVIQVYMPSRAPETILVQKARTELYDLKCRSNLRLPNCHSIHNAFDNQSADASLWLNCAQSAHVG
jgi:hypothetical protein